MLRDASCWYTPPAQGSPPARRALFQYSLVASTWSVPVKTWEAGAEKSDGVFLIEDCEELNKIAAAAIGTSAAIAVVFPRPVTTSLYHSDPATVDVEEVHIASKKTKLIAMRAHIIQFGNKKAVCTPKTKEVVLATSKRETAVVRCRVRKDDLSEQQVSDLNASRTDALCALVKASLSLVAEGIMDAWGAKQVSETEFTFMARIDRGLVQKALQRSGMSVLFVDTPVGHTVSLVPIWMKEMRDGKLTPMSLEEARVASRSVTNHAGLIFKGASFGLRVAQDDALAAKRALKLEPTFTWKILGAHRGVAAEDLDEALKTVGWTATVVRDSRRCTKTRTSWLARSDRDPPQWRIPMSVGDDKMVLTVKGPRQASREPPMGSACWTDAVSGKFVNKTEKLPIFTPKRSKRPADDLEEEAAPTTPARPRRSVSGLSTPSAASEPMDEEMPGHVQIDNDSHVERDPWFAAARARSVSTSTARMNAMEERMGRMEETLAHAQESMQAQMSQMQLNIAQQLQAVVDKLAGAPPPQGPPPARPPSGLLNVPSSPSGQPSDSLADAMKDNENL